jgi:hypothetical protein
MYRRGEVRSEFNLPFDVISIYHLGGLAANVLYKVFANIHLIFSYIYVHLNIFSSCS